MLQLKQVPVGKDIYNKMKIITKALSETLLNGEFSYSDEKKALTYYRGWFHEAPGGLIELSLLASNYKGNFKIVSFLYDSAKNTIEKNCGFTISEANEPIPDEKNLLNKIRDFIQALEGFPFEVSQIYFDVVSSYFGTEVKDIYCIEDVEEAGNFIVFVSLGELMDDPAMTDVASTKGISNNCLGARFTSTVQTIAKINENSARGIAPKAIDVGALKSVGIIYKN